MKVILSFSILVTLLSNLCPGLLASETGRELYSKNCASCHGSTGVGDVAKKAPSLLHLSSWELTFHLERFLGKERPSSPSDVEGHSMAAQLSNLSKAQIPSLVAFLSELKKELPDQVAINGNANRGENIYALCASCHGAKGEGNEALHAPGLAGAPGWYLVGQLQKFKSGARGNNPSDMWGYQMGMISLQLSDDKAIADVVAYLQTLSK